MVAKDWTVAEVMAANEVHEGPPHAAPAMQWAALLELDELEQRHLKGNRMALMRAINLCARHELVMPQWVATAYMKACQDVCHYRAGSWDQVFGKPHRSGLHLDNARQQVHLRWKVLASAKNITKAEPDISIDDGLFERIGDELGIGKTLANKLYYSLPRAARVLPRKR